MAHSVFQNLAGKNIFVTGHTGFKGSWLCQWLSKLGANVTGYALAPPTDPNNFTISNVRELLVDHHEADIRDQAKLHKAIRDASPDVVFHLAAQSVVRKSYETPLQTFDVNVMGTASVLEALRDLNHPCAAVIVTSDKCYENREQTWGYRECDAFGDQDPYGGSKGAAEIVVRSYRHSFFPPERLAEHGVKIASARAGNVIGGGDFTKDALIVDIVNALRSNKPVELRCPGAFRPWQHVLQALSGYLTLASRLLTTDDPALCSGWNIGPSPGNEIPVRDMVDLFLREWGSGSWVDVANQTNPHEANILRLAIDKALWQLKWKPCWSVEESVRQTAKWYRCYLNTPQEISELNSEQIIDYQSTFERMIVGAGTPVTTSTPTLPIPETKTSNPISIV
jgi:CDP-glucose 4,6-dehydratase